MSDLPALEQQFVQLLGLNTRPVAVSFCASAPTNVRKFMGQVPSGCSFWRLAATAPEGRSAFYTLPEQHYNCPVGSYTHGIELPAERAHELTDVLGFMAQIGYVTPEEVPTIPRVAKPPQAVVYSRLGEAPLAPEVVIFALAPRSAMLLNESSRGIGKSAGLEPLPRPTCMAIPASAAKGTTLSLGCIGNRVYTEVDDDALYMMVRGSDLEAVLGSLEKMQRANAELAKYHAQRKSTLSVSA